jgi:hypothetical protein
MLSEIINDFDTKYINVGIEKQTFVNELYNILWHCGSDGRCIGHGHTLIAQSKELILQRYFELYNNLYPVYYTQHDPNIKLLKTFGLAPDFYRAKY